ncbi:MAG TPA: M14 family zinc carboxypeptidase [Nocardioidaceae bacterium]|nr:M14 family zinc carboxypeptidase [Nocardioidaceae bacterium]
MNPRPPSARARMALAVTASVALLAALVPTGAGAVADEPFAVRLVTVDTPTRADKERLQSLGLDLTEHAGHDYVEVVLHTPADLAALTGAGFAYDVRIPDLWQRNAEIQAANRAYAQSVATSPLPSGRDSYRLLEDYNADLRNLAQIRPDLVERFALPHQSIEGKTVYGVEIGAGVDSPPDGRPTFLMLGLHHAREWPSGEHAMEFAFDLVKNYGRSERITDLLQQVRVVVVPVVNVDGFEKSVNDGMLVDLREVDNGGTVSILGTPGNAYKRKNCRMYDGQETGSGECRAATSPGGYGVGIDLNRNYGGFWGGPGASDMFADPTYRGADAFSEPETQNIRELVSNRQVTTLITNHTFSNLVLRPNGVAPDTIHPQTGLPVGNPPDEAALKALGDAMAEQNGYTSQHAWELYDTTGSTEDWSYNATGGFGYTFEIGPNEFHPPFPQVIDEYLGAGEYAGKGNREAYLLALENAADTATHSVLSGRAPAGATLRLRKTFATPTWEGSFQDTLDSTMRVGEDGRFTWHVNPSTRPVVQSRQIEVTSSEPTASQQWTGTTLPNQSTDQEYVVTEAGVDLLEVNLDWPTPDDLDLYVLRKNADGSLTEVASSAGFVGEKERALVSAPEPGTYVLRVTNFASVAPQWTLTAEEFDTTAQDISGLIENYTLSCERDGTVLQQTPVVVDRGEHIKVALRRCLSRW